MPVELQTALIAASVALITAAITGFFTWTQIRRERTKWLIDLKSSYAIELYKVRIVEYSKLIKIIGKLSSHSSTALTPEITHNIANEINNWFYSTGGLCADKNTRGAILGLRRACSKWERGKFPPEIRQWGYAAVFSMRRDLDIIGLEAFDPNDVTPLLEQIKKEIENVNK